MRPFRRKQKAEPPAFDTDELRRAADRLTGWTITGSAALFDPPTLLRNAAIEIDRLVKERDRFRADAQAAINNWILPPLEKLAASVAPVETKCDYCGDLDWTLQGYGRVTHKQSCPHRTDPWHQGEPNREK